MNEDYWTSEDKFIFKPEFNEPIDKYVEIIKNYSQLIFSNYDDVESCIETNNLYSIKYRKNYKESKFNKPLGNSLNNLTSLTHLTFGWGFNQPLNNSLNNLKCLTHLTLGCCFNQSIEIPFYIKNLTLSCNNVNLIDNLHNNIE